MGQSLSTTIYSGWGWDECVATAVLATALLRKGYKVYIEFPSPSERRGLFITKSYAVGFSHREGSILNDAIAIQYLPDKRLGVILKYDSTGKGEVIMRFSNVSSLTMTLMEYVQTLNENVTVPEQLLRDIENINSGDLDKLSKVGKLMVQALKINYSSKEFRQVMYSFAMEAIRTRTVRATEDLAKEAQKYDEAMEIGNKILEEKQYIPYGDLKVLIISSKCKKPVIKENYSLLRPVAYDLLLKVCREDGVGILVQETELGHTIRICLRRRDVSFVNVIASIPKDLSDLLNVSLRGNHIIIKYRNPAESTLDNVLQLVDTIAHTISEQLKRK